MDPQGSVSTNHSQEYLYIPPQVICTLKKLYDFCLAKSDVVLLIIIFFSKNRKIWKIRPRMYLIMVGDPHFVTFGIFVYFGLELKGFRSSDHP